MNEKDLSKLREDHQFYGSQLERNLELLQDNEDRIMDRKLENKNYKEKITFLQAELKNKRMEYSEKIERIQKKKQDEEEGKKHQLKDEKSDTKDKIDIAKINKLVDLYKNTKSFGIVEGVMNDFSKLTSEMDKTLLERKMTASGDISFVSVKHEDSIMPFKITDEFYTFSDLLKEACRYFAIEAESNRIHDHDLKTINMVLGVRDVLRSYREKLGIVPNLTLLPIKENAEVKVEVKENEEDELGKPSLEIDTADLLQSIDEIENQLLEKIMKIIFFLVFLLIIFVYNISNSKIPQTFYINNAFYSRMVEKKYFAMNEYGLENNFLTISRIPDILSWGFNSFVEFFSYPTYTNVTLSDGSIVNQLYPAYSRVIRDFVNIGPIRFMHSRLAKGGTPKLSFSESGKQEAFDAYTQFLEQSPLDPPISLSGQLNSYYLAQAYTVTVPPIDRDMFLIFSMFRNVNLVSVYFESLHIQFDAYNYNNDVYTVFSFLIEQNKYGTMAVNYNICVLNYLQTINNLLSFTLSLQLVFDGSFVVIVFLYSLYNVIDIIVEIKQKRHRYFYDFWNLIKFIMILLYVMCLTLRARLYLSTLTELVWVDEKTFKDHSGLCSQYDTIKVLEILMVCFTMIYLLNYLDKNIVGPIFDTLYASSRNIIVFITSYLFTITGYAFFVSYVFGVRFLKLSTLDRSIINLFLMIFGDFSIVPELSNIFSNVTYYFLFGFALTFFMLFSNWLNATIVQWYDVVKKKKSMSQARTGTINIGIFDELEIVSNKFIRAIMLFFYGIIDYVTRGKELKDTVAKEPAKGTSAAGEGEDALGEAEVEEEIEEEVEEEVEENAK